MKAIKVTQYDMNKRTRILIRVREEHIALGASDNCSYCPIALAIGDTIPFPILRSPPVVTNGVVNFVMNESLVYSILPRSARKFIKKFDNKESVKPFNFYLNPKKL